MIFREGSGVAALACCRAATDSLLLLTNFLCHNVKDFKRFGEKKEKKKSKSSKKEMVWLLCKPPWRPLDTGPFRWCALCLDIKPVREKPREDERRVEALNPCLPEP